MITIKLRLTTPIEITDYMRQYSNVTHVAYNRLMEGMDLAETEWFIKNNIKNIHLLDRSFWKVAVNQIKRLIGKDKVIFGGKKNWRDYNKGLISKEEYKKNKLLPVMVRGAKNEPKGNRKFQLDMDNHQVIFKPDRYTKIYAKLPKTKHDLTLRKLQGLCELHETYFTCALSNEYIWITYDETILNDGKYRPIRQRILAVDLNPNYIAFVIRDQNKILHKEILGSYELNTQNNTNKKHHEDFEITKRLVETAKHYRCEYFVYEKLSIESSDRGKGKQFNKWCNYWRRRKLIQNILKRCNILGINHQDILPQYSSFIGQINNPDEVDSIGAAIELSRRGLLYVKKYYYNENIEVKGKIIGIMEKLPDDLTDRWKKKLNSEVTFTTYKSLYDAIKKTKYNYRNLFQFKWFSLRMKSHKSKVYIYV